MKMCRRGGRVIAMAFVASLSSAIGFSARAADLAPIVQGGGYYNWNGYYVGGNLGAGVGRTSFTAVTPGLSTSPSDEIRGFVGGGQGGFNWQFGPWVAGVEADLQFSHQQNGVTVSGLQFANTLTYFSTLRGRVGYAMDEWLLYATAGGGYGGDQDTYSFPILGGFTDSNAFPLWVVGAGVETQIWERWTGRIEYLYLQSGSISNTLAIPGGGTLAITKTVHDNVIRTGLNYHF
jgi:outer membrane immunogenic protein